MALYASTQKHIVARFKTHQAGLQQSKFVLIDIEASPIGVNFISTEKFLIHIANPFTTIFVPYNKYI